MNEIIKIQNMLSQVSAISKKYQSIAKATGENFNIFNILGLSTREVRTHSAFIAELLDPNGSHELGGVFLDLFLETIASKIGSIEIDTAKAKVYIEKGTGAITKDDTEGGNIDIIISDDNYALIIENKINARDQKSQLIRYFNYGIQNYSEKDCTPKFKLLYLTLDGKEASDFSVKLEQKLSNINMCFKTELRYNENEKDYSLISYHTDIINWLTKCKEKAGNHLLLKETIIQYINLTKQLTGQTMNDIMKNEIVEAVTKDNESLNAYFELVNNSYEVKYRIFKCEFLKALGAFKNVSEKINNGNEKAIIELKDGYKLGVWLADNLDYLIIGIIIPQGYNFNSDYASRLKSVINSKINSEIQEWSDGNIIAFRPDDYSRLNIKEPWLRIKNGDFKIYINEIVENVNSVI